MIGDATGAVYETPGGPDELYCPVCNADLRLAHAERGPDRPPKNQDLTVCHECLSFLRYVEPEPGLLRLDHLSDALYQQLPEKDQAALLQVRGQVQIVKQTQGSAQPTIYEAALNNALFEQQRKIQRLEAVSCPCAQCRAGEPYSCHYRRVRHG